ncbi:hypothetical protein FRX31_005131 [Thalictrum thalictroides]|uniref:Uncharacterized protein n=1 Tax=Thalictrum thalictroides TaxID=46969 RepID=A0A7J6XA51_THATH|nr:hypothetical protein FRX31_005131 [Thalictrum thalictroides]
MLKEHHHLDDNRPQEDLWDHTIIHLKCKPTSAIRFLANKPLLYWFFEGYLTFYSPENGYMLKSNYPLPPDVDFSLTCDFELKYHIENLLSLQSFVPSHPSQAGTKKKRLVVEVKSVTSL